MAAELKRDTILYKEPAKTKRIGTLPRGTIVTLRGESTGAFVAVEVELVDKTAVGWVDASAIKRENPSEGGEALPSEKHSQKSKILKKGFLPRDETVLLRREPAFYYALYGSLGLSLIDSVYNANLYSGLGMKGGGYFGWYLDKAFSLRLDLGFSQHAGTGEDLSGVGFSFFDLGVAAELMVSDLRFFAQLQYSFGAGLGNLPAAFTLVSASDLSGVWLNAGAGYYLSINDYIGLVPRIGYAISLDRTLVGFQAILGSLALEFQG